MRRQMCEVSHLCETDEGLQLTGGDGCAVRCLILFAQLQIKVLQNPRGLCGECGVNVMPSITHILPQKLVRNDVKILSRKQLYIKIASVKFSTAPNISFIIKTT